MALTREERLRRRRQSYAANRARHLKEAAEYRAKNKDKVRVAQAAWYEKRGAEHARQRYRSNPDRALQAARQWMAKNPDYHRNHAAAAYYADVEAGRAKCRQHRAANVEHHRRRVSQWLKANRDRGRDIARRRRARKIAATVEQFDEAEIFERDNWHCYICSVEVSRDLPSTDPKRAVLEHVVALAAGGAHSRENSRCACFRCNAMKGAHLTPEQVRARLAKAMP